MVYWIDSWLDVRELRLGHGVSCRFVFQKGILHVCNVFFWQFSKAPFLELVSSCKLWTHHNHPKSTHFSEILLGLCEGCLLFLFRGPSFFLCTTQQPQKWGRSHGLRQKVRGQHWTWTFSVARASHAMWTSYGGESWIACWSKGPMIQFFLGKVSSYLGPGRSVKFMPCFGCFYFLGEWKGWNVTHKRKIQV